MIELGIFILLSILLLAFTLRRPHRHRFPCFSAFESFFVLSSPLEVFEDVNVCLGLLLETISSLFRISLQEEKNRKNDKNNTLNQQKHIPCGVP